MNKIMCLIPLLCASLTTVSLSIDDNTSFLAKISLFPFRSDYSIYCVLKIGTTQLYTGRVISQSFCTMFFVPTLLCLKQTVQGPSQRHRGDQLSIWTTLDDRLQLIRSGRLLFQDIFRSMSTIACRMCLIFQQKMTGFKDELRYKRVTE